MDEKKVNEDFEYLTEEEKDFDIRWDKEFSEYVDTPISLDKFHEYMKKVKEFK